MKFHIKGRCAVITGAAGLLGIAHAKALLDIGATTILTDINEVELRSAGGQKPSEKNFPDGNIHMYPMDVTSGRIQYL